MFNLVNDSPEVSSPYPIEAGMDNIIHLGKSNPWYTSWRQIYQDVRIGLASFFPHTCLSILLLVTLSPFFLSGCLTGTVSGTVNGTRDPPWPHQVSILHFWLNKEETL